MPTYAFAVEAQTATVDALTAATGDFAGGTHANIIVPQGVSKIYQIGAAAGFGATAGAATMGVNLSGGGVVKEQRLVLAAFAGDGTAVTMDQVGMVHDVDIAVIPGGTITVQVFNGGSDTGTPESGVGILMR